ncbi:MAG: gluconate 2-dehydrogenase subunit 3 family protein [Bacteroidota bacterium]
MAKLLVGVRILLSQPLKKPSMYMGRLFLFKLIAEVVTFSFRRNAYCEKATPPYILLCSGIDPLHLVVNDHNMTRRNILRYTVYAIGGAGIYSTLPACSPSPSLSGQVASVFDANQMSFIKAICDALLPSTDTPGAVELGVPEFFATMVGEAFPEDRRKQFMDDLASLSTYLDEQAQGSFIQLNTKQQSELLTSVHQQWQDSDDSSDARAAYEGIRSNAIHYYLNTEEVATKQLNYLPVPGAYEACIDVKQVNNKSWAI